MVQPWNLGPGLMDFSPIGNLGKTFQQAADAATKRDLDAQRRQTFAALGQGDADYATVGKKLLSLGEVEQGAALIGLGQKAEDRRLELDAYKNSPFSGGARAAPTSTAPVAGPASLIQNESGGNWQAQNDATGAGGMKGHFGRLQFGQARLQEAQAAGVIPAGTTPQQFMQSPELQKRAEQWHFNDIDSFISQNGLDKVVGREINGVPVTVDGMRAVAHLGGKQGLAKFIVSGGKYNPADENGTRLSDYFARHGGGGGTAPVQAATAPRPVQVAETEEEVQRLEAQQSAAAPIGGGTYAQSSPEELNAFLQNPRVPENLKTMMRQELASRQSGQAPVQMAQAPAEAGAPVSDVPAAGAAAAQGFVVPPGGSALPPNDPYPQVSNQQLVEVIRNPRSPAGDKTLAQQIFASRQAYSAENAPDKREKIRLENEKARREIGGKQFRVLNSQERAAAGIDPAYKGVVQIDRDGQIHFPGKASSEINFPPAEKEYDKQAAKDFAEMNTGLIKGAQTANQKIATLNRLETLLSDPNIRTGAGAQLALQAARLGKSVFGIDSEGLGPAEAINAIANQFALELRNPSGGAGMPGALSDKDREFLMQSTPGLERDPAGNKLLIDYMRRVNQRSVDVERLRRDYVKTNKRLDEGFFDKLAEFSEKNPLFPEADKTGAAASPQQPPKRGDLVEGWRFKGGDPSDQKNWHKVN